VYIEYLHSELQCKCSENNLKRQCAIVKFTQFKKIRCDAPT
jgi:hypothetical protein